mgnify:CR=1 FL=1
MKSLSKLIFIIIASITIMSCEDDVVVVRTTDPSAIGRWVENEPSDESYNLLSLAGTGYYSLKTYNSDDVELSLRTGRWYAEDMYIVYFDMVDGTIVETNRQIYQAYEFDGKLYLDGRLYIRN